MDITPGDGFGRSIFPKVPDHQALFPLHGGSLLKFHRFFFIPSPQVGLSGEFDSVTVVLN